MHQLTSLDAQFLAVEDGRTTGHVCALAILDPATRPSGRIELDDVRRTLAERIHLLDPFRWRLRRVPFGVAHPFWVADSRFDLDFHIRELALPAPGSDTQLHEQVSRIHARPLDRGRPLWELYLIHGLTGDRVALLTKIHHAAIDGVSGAELLSVLLDASAHGRELDPAPPFAAETPPHDLELLARGSVGLLRQPLRALRSAPRTVAHLDEVVTLRSLPGVRLISRSARRVARPRRDGGTLETPRMDAPRTPLNGAITPHRRFATVSLPLDDVKRVKNTYGTTVNDVVVALCAGAVRRWLIAQDALPADPLLAMIPVSVRTDDDARFGNRVSTMVIPLPTQEGDASVRIGRCHKALSSAKKRHRALPATLLQDANEFIPPALFGRAARTLASVGARDAVRPPVNVVISNVPGSPTPLYFAGARLLAQYPVSAIMDGVGLNLTVLSYRDSLDFGLVADRDQVPDLDTIADGLREELHALLACVKPAMASTL